MFVITAIVGNSFRNDRSLSSASATISSPRPEPRVAAEGAQPPADHRRRIESGALEHQRDHRRRRRLAVRAGDRDRVAQPHQLREHLGPRNHRNLPPRRLDDLGVRRPHRRRHHHDVRVADVRRVVPVARRGCPASPAARSPRDRFSSEPLTTYPRLASSSAIPLMPMPPIPMKCTRRVLPSTVPCSSAWCDAMGLIDASQRGRHQRTPHRPAPAPDRR